MWPRVQHPSHRPPSSPYLLLRIIWSKICTVLPPFHKLNSDSGFFSRPSTWERYINTYIWRRHHLGLWTCSMSVIFHKRPLCCCFISLWGKLCWRRICQIEMAWRQPPSSVPCQPPLRMLKPDLYMLFGQTVDLTDIHNVVLGQPAGILKPQSCYVFFFLSFLNNQSGTIL